MTGFNPYISIVAVSRNDDHGGYLLPRMQLFIDSLYEQCNRYNLPVELIIIEWNPPQDKKNLCDALVWPENKSLVSTKIITVSPELHNRFRYGDKLPIFQMIGKNVGIRRARGKFILATNIDILFSNQLIEYLSTRPLKKGHHYRVDRLDVDSQVLFHHSKETLIADCRKNIIRVNKKYGTYPYKKFPENFSVMINQWKDYGSRVKAQKEFGYPLTHSNACGDFALMAKEDWETLSGYPELEMYSFHIDSLILVTGYYRGIKEVFLKPPKEIFHIEHSAGSGWTPGAGEQKLFGRLKKSGIPSLTWGDLLRYANELRQNRDVEKTVIGKNNSHWGLFNDELPEVVIH